MSDRRVFRWATTSARLLAGTLVAVAFVVGVVTAVSVPWPTVAREPVAIDQRRPRRRPACWCAPGVCSRWAARQRMSAAWSPQRRRP